MWPQLMELRLEVISLKFDRNQEQHRISELSNELKKIIEKSHSEVMLTLSEVKKDMLTVKDDVNALKRRQELVFKNQDIIHSTLAGEVRREHLFFMHKPLIPLTECWTICSGMVSTFS